MRTLAILAVATLSWLGASPVVAAEQPALYRVELVLFVNTSPGAGTEESWPQPQGLAYPQRWKVLDADAPTVAEVDGDGAAGLPLDASQPGAVQPGVIQPSAASATPLPPAADAGSAGQPVAWRSLPEANWRLADSAARLEQSGRYRVLLHRAWLQPLAGRDQDAAVVLAGGEQFGDHHELEGYLSLSQERFVHVDAEFWLSRFRFGSGLEATLFSPLPLPPQRQAVLGRNWFGDPQSAPSAAEPGAAAAGRDSGFDAGSYGRSDSDRSDYSRANYGDGAELRTAPYSFNQQTAFGQTEVSFDHQYVPSQIFVLKQKQRVAPEQLTYLDHPLMGALLLVTPVEAGTEAGQ